MKNQQKFLLGVATGAAAVVFSGQLIRRRHAIDLAGRTVVITGGSRGLGLVMARQLVDQGARVCLLARDAEELARARAQLMARGATEVLTIPCDVRSSSALQDAVDAILEARGAIDVLVNNAGVIQVGPLEHMELADFENAMNTHFWGPYHLMQAVVPGMRRRGFGRIVNVASIGGRMAVPHLAPYSASKFALVGLSDAFRAELAQHGIRVTTVSPGLMRTGSPINAQVKGQHTAEFTWFAIADALPGLSMSAERAAADIIDACRYGDPELTLGGPARLAAVANAVTPALVARALMIATKFLPGPAGVEGDSLKSGRQSSSGWAPSSVTTLSDRAAAVNNELLSL